MKYTYRAAFTLVELMIVIAVIAILAGIAMMAYPNWRDGSLQTTMKSDLHSFASAMEDSRNYGNKYPSTYPSGFKPSGENIVQLVGVTDTYYCVDIYNNKVPGLILSYDSESDDFRNFPCSGLPTGSPVGGTVPAAPRGVNLSGDFAGWELNGTAVVSNGILTLGSSGSAKSPPIRVSSPASITTGGDLNASQQSPNVSLQPNAGYHVSIYYYASDGVTAATNNSGATANGCARAFTKGGWQAAVGTCGFTGGPNVIYVRIVYWSSASSYASPDLKVRSPLVKAS